VYKRQVLIGAHFATLDIISQALADLGGIDVMYRRNKSPAFEWLQVRGRRSYFKNVIERGSTRTVLRALKSGRAVWYAADQDYGAKHSVFAPFFGVPAATITGTARLAAFNGSLVIMMSQQELPCAALGDFVRPAARRISHRRRQSRCGTNQPPNRS